MDDEQKEILRLLYLIKEYAVRIGGDESPTRIAYVDRFIHEYSKETPNVSQSNFTDLHDPKDEASDLKNAVRVYMRREFLPFMESFFETEGRGLRYHLTFRKKGYSIILKENPFWSQRPESKGTRSVSYVEHTHLKMRYRPVLFYILYILAFMGSGYTFIKGAITVTGRGLFIPLFFGFIFLLISVILFFSTKALVKVSEDKFSFFILNKFFFKLLDESLSLTSYDSLCPVCGGKVILRSTRKKNVGYIAECQRHPKGHTFSFDHVLLTGEQLSP